MPCPHNEITIVQRSQRQSAVAAAAYQSGEKLFCEYDQQVKHYPEKRGIVHNEILLPANAPPEYADRNTLWNAAEAVEKQWNSQLARRWVLTIPREIPPDQYAVLVREFCEQQFVSKGMIVDFAIHDPHPPGHNPHAHVLLTMRAMDEHGKWLPKSRKVYDLDENGERIKLPSGRWKSHKEDTVDWNDQKYCEIWRHEWEVIQNRYLEANDRPERVDLRSYPQLPEALRLIRAWGFTYKSVAFVWLKKNRKADSWFYGLGFWTRANAEVCLLATKGHPKRQAADIHQFIISPIEAHSKKPDETRDKIVALMGDLPRVELFARQTSPGWDVWGNEVEPTIPDFGTNCPEV